MGVCMQKMVSNKSTKTTKQTSEVNFFPNLRTILMIEDVLKEADGPISRAEVKRRLPKQVMHQTLNTALKYLEAHNIILDGRKGIIWIENHNPVFLEMLSKSKKL